MLLWRLTLGLLFIGLLAALCWADINASRPGVFLVPIALVLCVLSTQEILRLLRSSGKSPAVWSVYVGTFLPVLASCAPLAWSVYPTDCPIGRLGWLACGLVAGLIVALLGEMRHYEAPGQAIANLSATALSVLYVGGLLGFLVQLRLLPVAGDAGRGGMLALLSMIIVVKAADIGAYTAGRLFGRHKLAPVVSPGKTWEGAVGGMALATVGSMLALGPLADALQIEIKPAGFVWVVVSVAFALTVGIAGVIGDLAESLLKRDAGVKDSSTWLPGFGGVLDVLDSLLVAAPVAYLWWVSGLIG